MKHPYIRDHITSLICVDLSKAFDTYDHMAIGFSYLVHTLPLREDKVNMGVG